MAQMLINSLEHKNLAHFLALCRTGTPTEVYAHIMRCGYDADFLNEEHYAIHYGPLYGYLPYHPLAEACIGDNVGTARFLLEFGVDPDPDIKWGRFKSRPPRLYAIGKAEFTRLFETKGDDSPWWLNGEPGLCPMGLHQQRLPQPAVIIWHVMRGRRLDSPEAFLHDDFRKFPAVLQEFICRIGVKREEYASYQEWLAAHGADANLLDIFRVSWTPCAEKSREALVNLLISSELLERNRLFSLVNELLPPHDLVSLLMEFREQYEASGDREYTKKAVDLLLGAIIAQCPE